METEVAIRIFLISYDYSSDFGFTSLDVAS